MTKLSPTALVEEASAIPLHVLPAFVGSGTLGVGIDASGLQCLDNRMAPAFGLDPTMDDLYLLRHGFVSRHLGQGAPPSENFMPLGFLTWAVEADGACVTPDNLADAATLWRRTVDLSTASVETEMVLLRRVRLRIRAFVPHGTDEVHLEFGLRRYDARNQRSDARVRIALSVNLRVALRDGSPIFESHHCDGQGLEATASGHEQYHLRYRWRGSPPWHPAAPALTPGLTFGLRFEGSVGDDEFVLRCALDCNANGIERAWDYDAAWQAHVASWAGFWGRAASIDVADVEREFMYANSLYLLRCGHDYAQGGTGSFLIQHQPFWHASTFWDMQFVCDGLLHAGASELVAPFVGWLARVARPEGRPFPWMMMYDGSTVMSSDEDAGVVVNLAFATAALRAYLDDPGGGSFTETVWPVCDPVCRYMAEDMFAEEAGRYVLAVPCGHDVGAMAHPLVNETYTALWAVSVLVKTMGLAEAHGLSPRWLVKARLIATSYYLENDGERYLHARAMRTEDFDFASWLPNLLYPTEGLRFLDRQTYERTRATSTFAELYMSKQGDFQPWCSFWGASSDLRLGDAESANQLIEEGLQHIYGPGYFCEVGPGQWGNAILPPYPTPHGAYLTTASEQLVVGSYWTREVFLFTNVPAAWRERTVRVNRLHSGNGVVVDGTFGPGGLRVTLTGNGRYTVHCAVPDGLAAGEVEVLCQGLWRTDVVRAGARGASDQCGTGCGVITIELELGRAETMLEVRKGVREQ